VRLADYATALGDEITELRALYPDGVARLWGATPSALRSTAKAIALRDRRVGDRVLFYADRHFFAEATIVHLFRNAQLARSVWGSDHDGEAWEHLMALDGVRDLVPPLPAELVLRPLGMAMPLRSLTLVPAEHHAELETLAEPAPVVDVARAEPSADEPTEEVEARWSTDAPASTDTLNRERMARVLEHRMREAHDEDPHTSLLVHLDGPWGAGKSTVLTLLAKRLGASPPFLVVWFDAWQQSRISPPWWALMTALKQHILTDRGRLWRGWFRVRETAARARVSGAPYLLALILLLLITAGAGYLTWLLVHRVQVGVLEVAKLVTPALVALGILWTGSRVAARVLLWDSARGARLFEQSNTSPMTRVSAHFDWLLRMTEKPVVFFVDDLDRCKDDYVVELLDAVHTLVRDAPRSHHRRARAHQAPYFVVAADGVWIRRSYDVAYEVFSETIADRGSSLGYLFLDKLFQLNVPMPALGERTRKTYLEGVLGLPATTADERFGDDVADDSEAPNTTGGATKHADEAAFERASAEARQHTAHMLQKFSSLLQGNPRSIKLFTNNYSVLRMLRSLEGSRVSPETLALWALIRVRWPDVADVLQNKPEAVAGIRETLWKSDHFPDSLHKVVQDEDLREVVLNTTGGPLTPDLIRQCCGMGDD
jgi:hypothetical protein